MHKIFAVDLRNLAPTEKLDSFGKVVNVVIWNAFVLAGLLCFALIVFGGFSIVVGAGGGDTKSMEKGRKAITGAIGGLLLVVVSVWILQILEKITGINLLKMPIL